MVPPRQPARVNVRALLILVVVLVVLAAAAFTARRVRSGWIAQRAHSAGVAAFEKQDWKEAVRQLHHFLERRPDNAAELEMYAKANLRVRPRNSEHLAAAMDAYRRVLRLPNPSDEDFRALGHLYLGVGDFNQLEQVAELRKNQASNPPGADMAAQVELWLARVEISRREFDQARARVAELLDRLDETDEKVPEYSEACILLATLIAADPSATGTQDPMDLVERALAYDPTAKDARLQRAKALRVRARSASESQRNAKLLEQARSDLAAVEQAGFDNPRIDLVLSAEWLEHARIARNADQRREFIAHARAAMDAADQLDPAIMNEEFLLPGDWALARFLQKAAIEINAEDTQRGVELANESLIKLSDKRRRAFALPDAIRLYVRGKKAEDAQRCLDEYMEQVPLLQPPPPRSAIAFLHALVAAARNEPYMVINHLEAAVAQLPDTPASAAGERRMNALMCRLLANALRMTNQPRREIDAWTRFFKLSNGTPAEVARLARLYLAQSDWSAAAETVRQFRARHPDGMITADLATAGVQAALNLVAQKPAEQRPKLLAPIRASVDELLAKFPKRVEVRILDSMSRMLAGDAPAAEAGLRQAIAECDNPLPARMQLMRILATQRKYDDAVLVANEACEADGDVAAPWLALVELQSLRNNESEARAALTAGIERISAPDQALQLKIRRALLDIQLGNASTAIAELERLADANPHDLSLLELLLTIPQFRQDRPAAEAAVQKLKAIETARVSSAAASPAGATTRAAAENDDFGIQWRLGQAVLWLDDPDWRTDHRAEIISYLQRCIEDNPRWPQPVLLLGDAYQQLGQVDQAESVFRAGLARNPRSVRIADRLIYLLGLQNRTQDQKAVLAQTRLSSAAVNARQFAVAINSGDIGGAINSLSDRIRDNPADAASYLLLARLEYERTKDAAAALAILEKARDLAPESPVIASAQAKIMTQSGDTDGAQRVLDELIDRTGSSDAYLARAIFFAGTQQPEPAERDIQTALDKATKSYTYVRAGDYFNSSEKPGEAIRIWQLGIEKFPADSDLQRRWIVGLLNRNEAGDRELALARLDELIKKSPRDADLWFMRAGVQMADHSQDESTAQILRRVVILSPNAVKAHVALVDTELRLGHPDAAREAAIRALITSPGNAELRLAQARAEFALGHVELSRQIVGVVLADKPDLRSGLDLLVAMAIQTARRAALGDALRRFDQRIAQNPNDVQLHWSHAQLLAALGRSDEAIAELEATRGPSPDDDPLATLLFLAQLRAQSDDSSSKQNAIELAQRCLKRLPRGDLVRLDAAAVLYLAGDYAASGAVCGEVLAAHPDSIRAVNDLAWTLSENDSSLERASELIRGALDRDPDNTHLLDTSGRLHMKRKQFEQAKADYQRCVQAHARPGKLRAMALLHVAQAAAATGDAATTLATSEEALRIDADGLIFSKKDRAELESLKSDAKRDAQ